MLGMPSRTPYDLRFRLFGIPVYVTPWFWLVMGILGWHPETPRLTLVFIGCGFVSILVHELGHGLTAKAFGYWPEIALYQMGGLCASEAERQTPRQRLAVLAWGPGAQFVLLALILATGGVLFGISWRGGLFAIKHFLSLRTGPDEFLGVIEFQNALVRSPLKAEAYWDLVQINLLWPLLNLLPIWPLDGGQITGVVLTSVNRWRGMRWAHIVSLLTAGILAGLQFLRGHQYGAFFLAYFAFINFQRLQALHHGERSGSGSGFDRDDADWWKR